MNRYRNSSSQEKLKNRRRNRNGKLVRSRGGNSDFSENKNHGVVGGGRSRLRKETSLPIPEDKPVEERNANSGVQIIIPEPIFFNANSIESHNVTVETEDKNNICIVWIDFNTAAKTINRQKVYKRRMLGRNISMPSDQQAHLKRRNRFVW